MKEKSITPSGGAGAVKEKFRWLYNESCKIIAYHLPRRIITWAAVRLGCHATTGKFSNQIVPELTLMDALQRWNTSN